MADETPPTPVKVFNTQDELNAFMAENRRNLTKERDELMKQVTELKTKATLTDEERAEYESRLNQFKTKEQLAAEEQEKQKKKYDEDLKKTQAESSQWQSRYSNMLVKNSLNEAALTNGAINPTQITAMLMPSTKVVLDKETNEYVPVVTFQDVDKDGKPRTLELSPMETVKRMLELEDLYGNLFKSTMTNGTGSNSGSKNKQYDASSLKDTATYLKARKEGKI